MSNDEPKGSGPPEILTEFGMMDAMYESAEWQEHARRTFRRDVDLDDLEVAQEQYREVRAMLDATPPYKQWLAWRPRDVKPASYRIWISTLQGMIREHEERFGVLLIAADPGLGDQRQLPQ